MAETVPEHQDEEWLREHYVEKDLTGAEVADLCGATPDAVYAQVKKFDLRKTERPDDAYQQADGPYKGEEWLREQYVDRRRTLEDIADECEVSHQTIIYWLEKFGIDRRSNSESHKLDAPEDHPRWEEGPFNDEKWLRREYLDKVKSAAEIARECDVHSVVITHRLNHFEINIRPGGFKPREHHPEWKGGHIGYRGPNWKRQRRARLEADGYACQICGLEQTEHEQRFGKELDVHHITPLRWFKEKYDRPEWYEIGNDLDNLVTLCRPCHDRWEGIPLRPETPD